MSPSPRATTHTSPPLNAYASSTQHRYWHWTPAQLQQHRANARDKAVAQIQQYLTSEAASTSSSSEEQKGSEDAAPSTGPTLQTPTNAKRNADSLSTGMTPAVNGMKLESKTAAAASAELTLDDLLITSEQEQDLILYYAQSIPLFSSMLQLPSYLTHTAHTFFQRYYCKVSAMSAHHPKHVMLGCFFLAGKAEDHWIHPEKLSDKSKTPVEIIIQLESPILEALQFHLRVWHPFRPLNGLLETVQDRFGVTVTSEQRSAIIDTLEYSYFTDVHLLHAPSHIAAAALYSVVPTALDSLLKLQPAHNATANTTKADEFRAHLAGIVTLLQEGIERKKRNRKEFGEQCKPIDKRVKRVNELHSRVADIQQSITASLKNEQRMHKLKRKADDSAAQRAELLGVPTMQPGKTAPNEESPFIIHRKRSRIAVDESDDT